MEQGRAPGGPFIRLGDSLAGSRDNDHKRIAVRPTGSVNDLLDHRRKIGGLLSRAGCSHNRPGQGNPTDCGSRYLSGRYVPGGGEKRTGIVGVFSTNHQRSCLGTRLVYLKLNIGPQDERSRGDIDPVEADSHRLIPRPTGIIDQLQIRAVRGYRA